MTQKTTPVPDELLRTIKAIPKSGPGWAIGKRLADLFDAIERLPDPFDAIERLPDPPKPHPLEAAGRAYAERFNANEDHLNPLEVGGYWNRPALKAALRKYREELGMDRDPELDE